MNYQAITSGAMGLALFAVNISAMAADPAQDVTHDGTIISITSTELVMMGADKKEHTHSLAKDATITLDEKDCNAKDLKKGLKVRVTTKDGDLAIATNVEAISKNAMFANTHEGKFVSATGRMLVMTGADGQEHSHTITNETKVTCDTKECKASDLKAGTRIRVTTRKSDKNAVTCIEAIVEDRDFATSL